MNSISSAAPCHVLVNWGADKTPSRHDVVCWVLDDYQNPVPYFVVEGDLYSLDDLHRKPRVVAATLFNGTVAGTAVRL